MKTTLNDTYKQFDGSLACTGGRFGSIALAAFIAFVLFGTALFAVPGNAWADVRKRDIILDQTVEQRNLSVSDCPSISATYAALISGDGELYFSRAGDDDTQIASITKVMAAIVALDNADLSLDVKVSAKAAEIGESTAGLQEGDTMDLNTALKAMLVPSGNDAAVAVAEAVGAKMIQDNPSLGDDPEKVFVDAMNKKAQELGLEDTLYENPHGLDDEEFKGDLHSTAIDQTKVAKCAMTYQTIRDIVGGGSTSISVMRNGKRATVDLETTDELLEMYKHAIGIKTGTTTLAGPSFMGAANNDGKELYAVVLDSTDEYTRFEDAKALFLWAYEHVKDLSLANTDVWTTMRKDGQSKEVPVVAEASHYEWIDRTVKATLDDPDAMVNVFDLDGNVSQEVEFKELHGTVNVGDKVGTIKFYQHNQVIAEHDLVACERVDAPNPIDTIGIWWTRLTQGLDDKTGRAESVVHNVMPVIYNNTAYAA